MDTMALDSGTWDLDLDPQGNLKTYTGNNAIAQNVATACLVWRGEGYFDTTFGVPYRSILGEIPALSVLTAYLTQVALTAANVDTANPQLKINTTERKVGGTILINGEINVNL